LPLHALMPIVSVVCQVEERYSITWQDALVRDDVETVEDPLHQTATAKHVFNDVYGAWWWVGCVRPPKYRRPPLPGFLRWTFHCASYCRFGRLLRGLRVLCA
jgi:hypothetical protein